MTRLITIGQILKFSVSVKSLTPTFSPNKKGPPNGGPQT